MCVQQPEQPIPISVLISISLPVPAALRHLRHLRLRRLQAQQRADPHPLQQVQQQDRAEP